MSTQILIKRNTLANIGTLGVGELYLATDTLDLYIGSASGNKLIGGIAALAAKVTANGAISGATKTKITYDAKGLVTVGADATTADIAESTNKKYVTDAQETALDAGVASGTFTTADVPPKTVTYTNGIITGVV